MSSTTLLLICTFAAVAYGVIPANFVPFGSAYGDAQAGRCDDCSFGPFNFDFMFYGTQRHSLFVNNNGLISFNAPIGTFTPVGMSAANFPAIAAWWADVDTSCGACGAVWYRSSTDATLLASVSAQVSSTFHGTHMFVATWDRVGYFASQTNKLNTFQIVLIADDNGNSWSFFHYDQLQWTTGQASGGVNGLGGTPASVGYSAGNGATYVQTPESLTGAVLNTRDSLTQVNAGTIVLPPPAPTSSCGNGVVEGSEECDGGDCCTTTCHFRSSATVCRAADGGCDVSEMCTGSSSACPADNLAAAGTVCRAAVDSCDYAEVCEGTSAECPGDAMDMSGPCFCGRQTFVGGEYAMNYFCTADPSFFYQCLQGPWASQSRLMPCATGTNCGCANGVECSCDNMKSPCVTLGDTQSC